MNCFVCETIECTHKNIIWMLIRVLKSATNPAPQSSENAISHICPIHVRCVVWNERVVDVSYAPTHYLIVIISNRCCVCTICRSARWAFVAKYLLYNHGAGVFVLATIAKSKTCVWFLYVYMFWSIACLLGCHKKTNTFQRNVDKCGAQTSDWHVWIIVRVFSELCWRNAKL